MNCKEGDVAICTLGEQAGKICEVVARGDSYREISSGRMLDGWHVSFPRTVNWGQVNQPDSPNEGWYPDEWLRPLRDQGGKDETLQWAPVPTNDLVPSN